MPEPKQSAVESVLKPSDAESVKNNTIVKGPDFDDERLSLDDIYDQTLEIGFEATGLKKAIDEINRMLAWRASEEQIAALKSDSPMYYERGCKIFLGFSSNMVSSGLRDVIRYLCEHKLVDCIVTSCGGIEEDIIKCLAPFYIADWNLKGAELRAKSLNRTGNLIVPNDNYCKFEDWAMPVLDEMYLMEQNGYHWTPSRLTKFFGKKINNESSYLYWAAVNNIPVFCPSITDGSVGDMLYFHSYKHPGLIVDVVADIRAMNNEAIYSLKNGCVIIGGGVCKHHIMNANLFTDKGADYAVYINTANEWDGCDSGAKPDEAVSWGKISVDATPVKVHCEATLIFPIIVRKCFERAYLENKEFYDTKQYKDPHEMYTCILDRENGWLDEQ